MNRLFPDDDDDDDEEESNKDDGNVDDNEDEDEDEEREAEDGRDAAEAVGEGDDDAFARTNETRESDGMDDRWTSTSISVSRTTSRSTSANERLRFSASLMQLYRLKKDGEYVAVGAAGVAILDTKGASARELLVYDPEKRPLVRRKIDSRLTVEPQRDNYLTVSHDESILWSALMRDEGDWIALSAQIMIAKYVARIKSEGFLASIMTIDLAPSSAISAMLEMGDSAQVTYEVFHGGAKESVDCLDFQLFDGVRECVNGLKIKLTPNASNVPRAVVDGLLGAGKDSRRLILAPQTESAFVVYDVTVTRLKKIAKEPAPQPPKLQQMMSISTREEHDQDEDEGERVKTPPSKPRASAEEDSTTGLRARMARLAGFGSGVLAQMPGIAAVNASTPEPPPQTQTQTQTQAQAQTQAQTQTHVVGTPPAPWWPSVYPQMPPPIVAMPPPVTHSVVDQALLLADVRRAVTSLSEDVSFLTSRARSGGAWIPPKLEGEMKQAVVELNKVRNAIMLPKIDVETLSIGDIKQLIAEAERVDLYQTEIREAREQLKRMRSELHEQMERTSRAEEERDSLEAEIAILKRKSEQDRERIEMEKRRAVVNSASQAAAAVEAVLIAEDASFDSDVAEVTARMREENERLRKKLDNPAWIEEQDDLRAERDALAKRVAELEEAK